MQKKFLAALLLIAPLEPIRAQQDTARRDAAVRATTRPDSAARRNRDLTLEPARTLSLDTDEGSWMSLDVSPDGRTIAFDLLGDLYLIPIAGGTASQLTSGMAFDAQPRFSPDGKSIAYTSDKDGGDNVWTLDVASRRDKQLTKGKSNRYRSPEWTPDGRYIVVSRSATPIGASKLWLFHADGGGGTQLIKDPQPLLAGTNPIGAMGAAFGKDERFIWYAQRSGAWEYNAGLPQFVIATFDRQNGRRENRAGLYGSAFRPALSADGKYLVYGSRYETQTGLRIRDLVTSEERWLAYPVQHDEQESVASLDVLPGYSFTPDSRAVVVSYGGKIWRVPVDGKAAAQIPFRVVSNIGIGPKVAFEYRVDDAPDFLVRQIRDAVPSPDGRQLAFVASDRLYVMDYPAGKPRQLINLEGNEAQPAWSPDGKSIAFVTWTKTGGRLYKIPASGGGAIDLAGADALYLQPAWSRDGRRVVFLRSSAQTVRESGGFGGPAELMWVPGSGGKATFIATGAGRTAPHFGPDSSRIFIYSQGDGLISFRWDGSDQRSHLKVTGAKFPEPAPGGPTAAAASLIRLSPTGDQALVHVSNDLYVVPVPFAGESPSIGLADVASAEFPARRLTDVGGQFPAWSANGRLVHWSIGNSHFIYDLTRARQVDDSVEEAKRARGDTASTAVRPVTQPQPGDSTRPTADTTIRAGAGPAANPAGYQPRVTQISLRAKRDVPQGTILLKGGRVITLK
ncbi:MAG: amidohydrolase, partial [Gemmatimonadaceae bacterium]